MWTVVEKYLCQLRCQLKLEMIKTWKLILLAQNSLRISWARLSAKLTEPNVYGEEMENKLNFDKCSGKILAEFSMPPLSSSPPNFLF